MARNRIFLRVDLLLFNAFTIGKIVNTTIGDKLKRIGISVDQVQIFEQRSQYSAIRLDELSRRLRVSAPIKAYPRLSIYAVGSYGRGEASKHSDIDLFFIHNDLQGVQVDDPRLSGIRVMSAVIREMEEGMEFPPPSNDGQFLNIISLKELLNHLGGPEDDYKNHFTARMLLLLESSPAFGRETYNAAIDKIIESYLRDYEDHAENFRPTFLANDIIRFWKTLCLNYEHRRNQKDESKKIKQKIRNFKLGFSRLLTCFATVSLLSSYNSITKEELITVCQLSPVDRLFELAQRRPEISDVLKQALSLYHWFLQKTELSTEELEAYFGCRANRVKAFQQAKTFGDQFYDILRITSAETGTIRYLVV